MEGARTSSFAKFALGAFGICLVLFALFAAQVFRYYRGIKRGDYVALPQFAGRLTTSSGQRVVGNGQSELASVGAEDDPSLGPVDAKLTIIQFADFECPYSREVYTTIRSLMSEFGGQSVRFVFRDMPLDDIHANARAAAHAAACASNQGKFWQMHDKLFANSDRLAPLDLRAYADQIGLDLRAYDTCLTDPATAAEVEADLRAGTAAGVRGTPTFFLNGRKVEGAIPPDIFKDLIRRFLSA